MANMSEPMRPAPKKHTARLYLVVVQFSLQADSEMRFRDSGAFGSQAEATRFAKLYSGDAYHVTMSRYERWSLRPAVQTSRRRRS